MNFKPLSSVTLLPTNWVTYDQYAFLIARTGKSNKQYVRAIAEESEKLQKGTKLDPIDALNLERRAFAATCIKNWGVVDDDGNIIAGALPDDNGELTFEFTKENVQAVAEKYVDLIDALVDMANADANFKTAREIETAKK